MAKSLNAWEQEQTDIRLMSVVLLALAIDHGLIEQWPFQFTRAGRRFQAWHTLLLDKRVTPKQSTLFGNEPGPTHGAHHA